MRPSTKVVAVYMAAYIHAFIQTNIHVHATVEAIKPMHLYYSWSNCMASGGFSLLCHVTSQRVSTAITVRQSADTLRIGYSWKG